MVRCIVIWHSLSEYHWNSGSVGYCHRIIGIASWEEMVHMDLQANLEFLVVDATTLHLRSLQQVSLLLTLITNQNIAHYQPEGFMLCFLCKFGSKCRANNVMLTIHADSHGKIIIRVNSRRNLALLIHIYLSPGWNEATKSVTNGC